MTCDEVRPMLHAYADHELDPATSLAVERHLDACAGCAETLAAAGALSSRIRSAAPYFRAPDGLRARLAGSRPAARRGRARGAIALAAGLAIAIAGAGLYQAGRARGAQERLEAEIVGSHVRSLMADHLTDVVSSDQHTVKPWFDGRIDVAPPAVDLAASGFPLQGGRLDYIAGRPVAALVYRHGPHVINLFLWPVHDEPDAAPSHTTVSGYHLVRWSARGLRACAVSDTSEAELTRFAGLFREQE